ncbi:hypothetical protein AB0L35_26565 [Streptomyces sp. NPDC052309]|uniref:hypothetical protein n=1 Tax=Streptomyces sp. NPDC052309 TaxID=3155421 RepID=UPI00343C4D25
MSRRPSHSARVLASVLAVGALLTTAACSGDDDAPRAAAAEVSPPTTEEQTPTASPGTLTESGAKAALLTEADLEDDWRRVDGADKWRDRLLVGEVDVADFLTAKADAADCQKLLDGLYADDLLGKPSGVSALAGFEQGDSRLLQQVAAYDRTALDDAMEWLKSLPEKCDQFTATDSSGGKRTVQVTEMSLPREGDARQGLHVTVQGEAADAPATLTLDVAAVRVGTDALTITAGGLDGGQAGSVTQGVKLGTQRLKDVLAGRTPSPQPGELD